MSFTKLYYHVVFSPKGRLPLISPDLERNFYMMMYNTLRKYNGDVIRIGGMNDHVHILLGIPPTISVSKFVQSVKRETSYLAPTIIGRWDGWQEGYGAFSCSFGDLPKVKKYIMNQKEHHKRVSFIEEYRNWLLDNGVSPDEPFFPK